RRARGGGGAVSLSAPEGRGGRAASAFPWHRGCGGCGPPGSLASSRSRRSRGAQLGGHCASGARPAAPPALRSRRCLVGRAAAAPSVDRRGSPAPRAPRTNFCPASPTSAAGSDWRSRRGARREAWVAAGAAPPRRDDLASVAPGLLCLGGRRVAARQRPTAPAGHVISWIESLLHKEVELEIVNCCERNNGGCSHHRERVLDGPRCSCNHGHRSDSDEKTCIDLDECESGEACCAQLCITFSGGYECSCQKGFGISSDGCGCDALDDDELEEEEEELEGMRFPGRYSRAHLNCFIMLLPRCLPPTKMKKMRRKRKKKFEENSTALRKVGCPKGLFGKNRKRKRNCANNGHCHRLCGARTCEPGCYGRFCRLSVTVPLATGTRITLHVGIVTITLNYLS
uniref:EGF-like domain-containing protein n=1 Tax=Equus caballus TaxID=9796 RepID=A0A9L0S383_HORSE